MSRGLKINNGVKICFGWSITYEDSSIILVYPLTYTWARRIQLTTNFSGQVANLDVQPGVWFGDANNSQCRVYGNSTILQIGTKIYFDYLIVGV